LHGVQGVGSSNLLAPTKEYKGYRIVSVPLFSSGPGDIRDENGAA